MGHPCAHDFRHRVTPLSVDDFDQHWWLLKTMPIRIETNTIPIGIETALKRVADEYENAPKYRKLVLLDYVLAVPGTYIRDPVPVRTRGRPTNSTQRLPSQFEHVTAALKAPIQRQRCRICQETGHNARTCRQDAQAEPTEPAPRAAAYLDID